MNKKKKVDWSDVETELFNFHGIAPYEFSSGEMVTIISSGWEGKDHNPPLYGFVVERVADCKRDEYAVECHWEGERVEVHRFSVRELESVDG